MTSQTATDFETQLDADPSNMELRSIYADWLEEQGDTFCQTQRWMVEHEKWPKPPLRPGYAWLWANSQSNSRADSSHRLPRLFFLTRMQGVDAGFQLVDTRSAAERWLHERLVAVDWKA